MCHFSFWNKNYKFDYQIKRYVEFYGLEEPSDDIFNVLIHIAKSKKIYKTHKGFDNSVKKMYDIDAAGHLVLYDFFNGQLGQIFLDDDVLDRLESQKDLDFEKFV